MTETRFELINGEEIKQEYRKKRKKYDEIRCPKGQQDYYLNRGWEVKKEYKTTFWLTKPKPTGTLFEDKLWCVFSKMNFHEMNKDNQFKIPISKRKDVNPKQIDVFVKDDEVVILIECKTAEVPTRKSFRTEINEINGIRTQIANSINEHYGLRGDDRLKVGYIFATENIIWNNSDLELAEEHKIVVLRDNEIEYHDELADHIGTVAKYQMLAEVFPDKKIPGLINKVPAIRGKLSNKTFYSFLIEPSKLLPLASVAHRMKVDKDTIITYQRMVNKKRLGDIREFLDAQDGFFPNSIIINFRKGKRGLKFEPSEKRADNSQATIGYLHLPPLYKSAWVIDGQHRLYGFTDSNKVDKVTIPVIAFEGLDASIQANLFIQINSKQKRVTPNLLHDLYSDLLWDSKVPSERLLALNSKIASTLGKDLGSPLHNKIKPSTKTTASDKPITLATITGVLNKTQLVGQVPKGSITIRPGPLFSEKKDEMRNTLNRATEVLENYLNLIKTGVPNNWDIGAEKPGYLCTNNGIVALIILFKEILAHVVKEKNVDIIDMSPEEIKTAVIPYLQPVIEYFKTASYDEIMDYRRQLGGAGQKNCAFGMMEKIHQKFPTFNPPGLENYIKQQESNWEVDTRNLVSEIELSISDHVISTLERDFRKCLGCKGSGKKPCSDCNGVGKTSDGDDCLECGGTGQMKQTCEQCGGTGQGPENEKWWIDGVPETVRVDVVTRQQKDEEHGPKEGYFQLIHFYKIIHKSSNWNRFKDTYAFKNLGNSKDKQLSWFEELNRIRKKVYHAVKGRYVPVTEGDYNYIKELHQELKDRIK